MSKIYSTAKVPGFSDPTEKLTLDDASAILAESDDPEELEHYWTQWRTASGAKMRDIYMEYVELTNHAARWRICSQS